MASSDQAKSKLLNSMRMSKQGTTEVTAPAEKPAAKENKKPASKPASAAKRSTKSSQATTKSAAAKKPVTDNFQAAQRVWPD